MMRYLLIYILLALSIKVTAQSTLDFNGLFQGFTTYSPESDQQQLWTGVRYIPELKYEFEIDSLQSISAYVSANIYGSVQYAGGNSIWEGTVAPYRAWVRYAYENSEVRIGLQKIDFGSSTLLRPLQWFNQIDPRDPLGLTNGVYAALGKYYFKNNANIWFWALYGNEETRGYDILQTVRNHPELGGRLQLPTPKGEIAFSYHHRTAVFDNRWNINDPLFIETPENKYGVDGKWDIGIGIWFEGTYTKTKDPIVLNANSDPLGLTHQALLDVGIDYTIKGVNIVFEHLFTRYGEEINQPQYKGNTSAISFNYPVSFFDNISLMIYQDWTNDGTGVYATYNHDFDIWTGYIMAYYNPTTQISTPYVNNDLNQFTPGFGLRLMATLNH
ncbi:hypothetical protein [Flammeovirga sp. SubArs3]|uniref:hypothetical protein n=1 Tax=Flammeovirga sp. SubArs3 TaxID=2995316 RepID=UPI00248AA56B|nr:hypothetical protein [Flammeovirga sp. SubArs3]